MAKVKGKSSLLGTTTAEGAAIRVDKRVAQAKLHRAYGTVENAASDSNGSAYALFNLPSHAILTENTILKISGWGFATVIVGTAEDTAALFSVAKTAGDQSPVTLFDTGHGVELWELLGMDKDPRGAIEVIVSTSAAATAAGKIDFLLEWVID